jgi:predicted dehydrogenase
MFCEWIWDGAIGEVHTIHAGCDSVNSALDQLAAVRAERPPVPAGLDWQQWLGPVEERPYNPAYVPGRWRRWTAFGNGTIGDWTCHVIDPVFWALDLGAPSSVLVEAKNYDPQTQGDTFPSGEIMTFEFPAHGKRTRPVTLKWFSGTETIPRPAELEPGRPGPTTGAVVMGDKGTIVYGSHGAASLRLIPEAKMRAYKRPEKTIPRVKGHLEDFYEAVKTGRKAGSDFSYGGPLTEIALLGVIGIKLAGQKLEWDAERMRFTNNKEANGLVRLPYRDGWEI